MGGAATHPQPQSHDHSSPTPTSTPRRRRFPLGSQIEVLSEEEDFRGVFFTATVIPPPPISTPKYANKRKPNKLYVEYHNLLANENASEHLREYVDLHCVRPPPPSQPILDPLEPGDAVDAFYKDGWWIGAVKQVLPGRRYLVTFKHPPDEDYFGISDLRVHWDWCDGNWVRPQKQSIAGLMFDVGRKVEVSLDRENCRGAWFPATIDKQLGNGAFLVDYRSTNKDNKVQAHKVTINCPYIRPSPPFLKDKNFVLLEKVDAFFDSGWWTGVITKELENGRYIVFFKQLKREKEFYQRDLRPHMEWKDGKWFTSSQDVPIQSSDVCMHEQSIPENASDSAVTVPLNSLGDKKDNCDQITLSSCTMGKGHSVDTTPDVQKMSNTAASPTKSGQRKTVSRSSLSHPMKKLDEGNLVGAQDKCIHDSSSRDMICDSVSPVSINNESVSATQTVTSDRPSDNPSRGKRIRRNKKNIDANLNVDEKGSSTPNSVNETSVQTLQLEIPNHDVGGKELDSVGNTAGTQIKCAENEADIHVVIGLPCAEMGSSDYGAKGKRGRHSNRKEMVNVGDDKKQLLNDSTVQNMKNDQYLEIGESNEKKKRGRPRKMLLEGNAENGGVGSDDLNRNDDNPHRISGVEVVEINSGSPNPEKVLNESKLTDGHSDTKTQRRSKRKRIPSKILDEKESPLLQGARSTRRGRRPNTGGKGGLQVLDSSDVSGGQKKVANQAMETKNAIYEASNNELDDEPLSKWIEGRMQSPSLIDGSRRPSPVVNLYQCIESVKKKGDDVIPEVDGANQPENGTDASALVDTRSINCSEPKNLPFVKNTFLWKTIESMEVFKRIPQNPHFNPLEKFKESSREGLAIGLMVTFSGVVEKARGLRFDDPKSVTEDILDTLAELEKHGFEVKIVQDRVNELLAIKEKQEKLKDDVQVLNNQLSEHNQKRRRMEEELVGIDEEMRKLQEKLSAAVSAKEKQDGEIASLETKLKETQEKMDNVGGEFDGIVSSGWGNV